MKKDDEKTRSKKRKIRFLTGPEVNMLKAFGENWESVIEECYNKIYQCIENDKHNPELKFENIYQRNAVKDYFLAKQFQLYSISCSLSLQILI